MRHSNQALPRSTNPGSHTRENPTCVPLLLPLSFLTSSQLSLDAGTREISFLPPKEQVLGAGVPALAPAVKYTLFKFNNHVPGSNSPRPSLAAVAEPLHLTRLSISIYICSCMNVGRLSRLNDVLYQFRSNLGLLHMIGPLYLSDRVHPLGTDCVLHMYDHHLTKFNVPCESFQFFSPAQCNQSALSSCLRTVKNA